MTSATRTSSSTTARWIIGIGAGVLLAGLAAVIWWIIAARAEPAGPTTEGVLPAATEMGVVELSVGDLDTMTAFYRDVIGLDVLEESDSTTVLGHDSAVIRLEGGADTPDDPRGAGLYHSAILFPDAPSLAATLVRVAQQAPELYQGSADHAVSLAFYLGDTEGNGIELYIDRPRDEWVWENGHVRMGSAPLDPNAFITEHVDGEASGTAVMGHVHLRVGDLDEARAFYSDVLGFDVTAETDGALFYSAGGYHHHLATNTWQSADAGARAETAGLRGIAVTVPADTDLTAVASRLADAGVAHDLRSDGLVTADPWGNAVHFVTAG